MAAAYNLPQRSEWLCSEFMAAAYALGHTRQI